MHGMWKKIDDWIQITRELHAVSYYNMMLAKPWNLRVGCFGRLRIRAVSYYNMMLAKRWNLRVGCFGRLRIRAAAPSRPPCQNCVGGFEKAVRNFAENLAENGKSRIIPVIGTMFDSWVRRTTSTICTHGRRALAFDMGRAGATSWVCVDFSLKEERMMQQSGDRYKRYIKEQTKVNINKLQQVFFGFWFIDMKIYDGK